MRLFLWIALALVVIAAFATQGHDLFGMGWPFWLIMILGACILEWLFGVVLPYQRRSSAPPPQ